MIAFHDNLPLVRFPGGETIGFDRSWMIQSLRRAADEAGYQEWWLAEHVTASVSVYLERDFDGPSVSTARLEQAVKSVLQVIGYADVASHFRSLPPPARLSLAQLAREAGCGYELMFFTLLQNRLRHMLETGAEHLEFEDLHPCVKMLRAAKNWRRDCHRLQHEIVDFVRGEINARSPGHLLSIQMS